MSRAAAAWVRRHPVLCFFVVFAIFPWVVPYKSLGSQVLIYGLFALGFNLLYGYTGLLSFGSAAYWGLGAYGTGIALAKLKVTSLWLRWGRPRGGARRRRSGGVLCLRRRGIYFAMLTLAFAQLLYFVGFHLADWTGGDDGLRGIAVPAIGLGGFTLRLDRSVVFYYFTLIVVGVAVAALKRILDSPFGAVLQAIRENADRATACGYDIARIKHLSFVVLRGLLRPRGVAGRAAADGGADRVVALVHLGPGRHHDAARRRRDVLRSLRRSRHVPRPRGRDQRVDRVVPLAIGTIFMAFVSLLPKASGARSQEGFMTVKVLELHHHGIRVGPSPEEVAKARKFYGDVLASSTMPAGRPSRPSTATGWTSAAPRRSTSWGSTGSRSSRRGRAGPIACPTWRWPSPTSRRRARNSTD